MLLVLRGSSANGRAGRSPSKSVTLGLRLRDEPSWGAIRRVSWHSRFTRLTFELIYLNQPCLTRSKRSVIERRVPELIENMERETGFEPATSSLGSYTTL